MNQLKKTTNIEKYNLFPIDIYKFSVDLDYTSIINKLYNLKSSSPERKENNRGGWQSNRQIHSLPELTPLVKHIFYLVNKIFSTQCKIKEMWGSISSTNDYSIIHNHPPLSPFDSYSPLWSGVYYLKTFPNSGEFNVHSYANVSSYQSFSPNIGDLILFNSNTYHSTYPNLEKEDRICIAFNLELS